MTNQQLEQFQLQQLQQRADPKALVVQQQSQQLQLQQQQQQQQQQLILHLQRQQLQQQLAQQLQGGAQSLHQIPWDVSGAGDGIVAASAAGALVHAAASQAISGQAGSGAKPLTFSLAPEGLPAGYPGPAKTHLASDVPSGSDTLAKKGFKEEGDGAKGKNGDSERDFNKKKRKVEKEEESSAMLTKGSKGEAPKKDREGKRKKRDDGDERRKESKKRKSGSGALDQLFEAATAMHSQNGQEETTSADSPTDEGTVPHKSPLKEEVDAAAGVKSGSERREAQTGSSPDPPERVVDKESEGTGEEEGGGKKPLSAILSDAAARDARRREESGDTDAGGGNSNAQRSATRVEVIDDVP